MSLQGRLLSDAELDGLQVSVLKEFTDAGVLPSTVRQTLSQRLF
jgi:hypothetical protein